MKMKKITYLLLFPLLFLGMLMGCTSNDTLDYTPYYEAKGGKGTEVYCWKTDDNDWYCGAMGGTNRYKFRKEILWMQDELPCSLSKMKKILKTFSEDERNNIIVFEVKYHISEEEYSELNEYLFVSHNIFLYIALGLAN